MHRSDTTRRKLNFFVVLLLVHKIEGEGVGRLFEGGGAYFKFRPMGGALIRRGRLLEGALIRGFTVLSTAWQALPSRTQV